MTSPTRTCAPAGRSWRWLILPLLLLVGALVFTASSAVGIDTTGSTTASTTAASPTITSDLPDYKPGGTVTLTGQGWALGETVHIVVNDTIGQSWQHVADATADLSGSFTDVFTLPNYFVSDYDVTATGPISGTATTTFTDAAAGSLDQCANDQAPSPHTDGCSASASDWVSGNVGGSKANYLEGDFLPYRLVMTGLDTTAAHSVTIEWDTTKSGKHALDYIGTYNATVATANPCLGVSGCSSSTTFPIPVDPQVTDAGKTQIPGVLTLFGGSISTVSVYSGGASFPTGDNSRRITIQFTATVANPVLAWGGHIASRADWGVGNAAVNISGSPFHTRLIELDGSGGNQDRSLSNDAVVFPGSITIVKDAVPNDAQNFAYSATGGVTPAAFTLDDDSDATLSNTQAYTGITSFATYTFTETLVSGWALTFASPPCTVTDPNAQPGSSSSSGSTVTVNLREGENYTCTFTNTLQTGTLIVKKHVVNDDGGTKAASDFTLHVKSGTADVTGSPAAGSESGTSYTLAGGTYAVSENAPPTGYTETGFSGDCDSSGNVTVVAGETKTCTITNDDQAGTLVVKKLVVNDNGGTKVATDFAFTVTPGTSHTFLQDGSDTLKGLNSLTVDAGTYSVSEDGTPIAGYTTSYSNCSGVAVGNGETKTCTITNDDQQATITVVKNVHNDNGGTAQPDDFKLTLEGNPVTSGVAVPVDPGTYTAAETLLSGYSFEGFTGDCDSNGDVTVALGEHKTCTLTNDDQQAYVIVNKVVVNDDGGTALPDDFKLTLEGDPVTSAVAVPVDPGTYTAGETQLTGYSFTGFSDDCDSNGDVTVALGETKTCTLTNDDQAAFVVVNKVVTNDDGGSAAPDDFALTLAGDPVVSGAAVKVLPGTYTADETLLSGYSFEGFTGDCDSNGDVTVALGETKSCTLTNDDQQASITVVKNVINDNGGSAQPDEFNLTLEGNPVTSGVTVPVDPGTYTAGESLLPGYAFEGFSGDCDSSGNVTVALGESKTCTLTNNDQQAFVIVEKVVVNDNGGTADPDDFKLTLGGSATTSGTKVPVDPGTYTAGETQLPGYSFTGFSGDCDSSGDVTVGLGETKICTLTNDDQQAYVTVVKQVVNDNGGSAQPDDFNLTLGGNATTSGVTVPVDPGTYTAGETQLPGYTFTGFSGDCDSNGDVTVALGESKTCTLTNDDQQASITVVKQVVNDDGGTAQPDDFTLTLEGDPVASGAAVPVDPGTYTAGETQLYGYTFTGFSGDCDSNGDVTVALGESKTCTLTNDDQTAHLTLVKQVTNDNGGTALAKAFTLSATGPTPIQGAGGADSDVDAGTYDLSETTVDGYTASAWSCEGGSQSGAQVTLALGESATCTITNDDQTAHLTLVKQVKNDNGGSADPTDFTLYAAGPTPINGAGGADSDVNAGTYDLSESSVDGYTASAWSCEGGSQTDAQVTLALGESATCTITNDDQQAYVIVEKVVTNDNGGSALPDDFKLTLGGNATTSGTKIPVDPGTYTAGETQLSGYTFEGFSGDCNSSGEVTVKLGETKTCTLTNDDQQGYVIVEKVVVNDNGGTAEEDDFKLTLGGSATTSGTKIPVDPGTYTAGETQLYGYTFTGFSGDCDSSGKVTAALGQTETCTLTNDDKPGTIVVKKVSKPVNTGSFAFTTTGTGYNGFTLAGGTQNSQTLNAGTYTVKESTQLGWILTGIGGSSDPNTPYDCVVTGSGGSTGVGDLSTQTATIQLKIGDTVTCTFDNTGNGATRTQGFWATHPQLAEIAWFGGTAFGHTFPGVAQTAGIGDTLICGRPVDDVGKLMGGFWSDISKTSTGKKRTSDEQARMQLLQQLLAAELNASAFGSAPTGVTFAQLESALCGTNTNAIKTAQQKAASFNTQGDSSTFTPGTSADSKYARSVANIPFWDKVKP